MSVDDRETLKRSVNEVSFFCTFSGFAALSVSAGDCGTFISDQSNESPLESSNHKAITH